MAYNPKRAKSDTIATVNSAITILEKYPELDTTSVGLSANASLNPIDFLVDLFKSTAGYERMVNILSKYIAYMLPELEITIKGILLSNIKNLLSCSLNPYITEDLLMKGIVFDMRGLDLFGKFNYSPLVSAGSLIKNAGRYMYFGCDGYDYAGQIEAESKDAKLSDFDALLWYTKNRSTKREVWKGVNNGGNDSDAIVTMYYRESPDSLVNAKGQNLNGLQTPYGTCLHVFIGDMTGNQEDITNVESAIFNYDVQITNLGKDIEELQRELELIDAAMGKNDEDFASGTISEKTHNTTYWNLKRKRENVLAGIHNKNDSLQTAKNGKKTAYGNLSGVTGNYGGINISDNKYYGKTIAEFNYDYVMSIKMFDPRAVAALLIDGLTNCITIDLNLSYEQLFVKYEIERLVNGIIETDDAVINDCFFSFTNDDYDKMSYKAEMTRLGLYTNDGEETTGVKVDASSIMSSLDAISDSASKETIQSVISGSLTEISKSISDTSYSMYDKVGYGARISFFENIVSQLAYVLTSAMLSPKLYLLFAVNLKLLGRDHNFSLKDFIEFHRQLIVLMIRAVRDELIKYLVAELMKIIGDLAKELGVKMALEQSQYYIRLIRRLVECFKRNRGIIDFDIGNVDYADIYEQETEPEEEC